MTLLRSLQDPGSAAGLYLGWIVWSSALVCLYGTQGLGCSLGWSAAQPGKLDSLTLTMTILWLAHLGLLSWLTLRAWRVPASGRGRLPDRLSDMQAFIQFGNRISLASAVAATAWLGFPILLLDPCA